MSDLPIPAHVQRQVMQALEEDLGSGDLTAGLISESAQAKVEIVCRESAVLCGTVWFDEVFRQLNDEVEIQWQAKDGDRLVPAQVICTLQGQIYC
ncbi:MAG: hypothetical protein KZQ77_17455 [Candidatus Thiodiazotropha sp. (ex Notomyrtea botanica)]|nr:hypothetical protein [Candidatus Thiodiazotropha sp. (ex Notomyrtea botanica)]